MLTSDITITMSSCVGMKIKVAVESIKCCYTYYQYRARALAPMSMNEYIEEVAKSVTRRILNAQTKLPVTVWDVIKNTVYNMILTMHSIKDMVELRSIVSLSIYEDDVVEECD